MNRLFSARAQGFFLLLLVLLPLLSGCAVSHSLVTGQKRAYAYTWSQERVLGEENDSTLLHQFGLYQDPALTAYVTDVGERVLQASHLRQKDTPLEYLQTPFVFRVLDTPVVNAFALPGGYVYVTRGLLAHMQNEAQLAVVLGHEIGHVAARHTSQRMLEAQVGILAVLGVSLVGEHFGVGTETLLASSIGAQLLLLGHSRAHERESDQLGVRYATEAGYRAREGSGFFALLNRLKSSSSVGLPGFLSTHPDPGAREKSVYQLASSLEPATHTLQSGEENLLGAITGMTIGDDPRWGFSPNSNAATFVRPLDVLQFHLPTGWQAHPALHEVEITPSETTGVRLLLRRESGPANAADAASFYLSKNENMQVLSRRSEQNAHVLEVIRTEEADSARLLLRFVEHQGGVYLFGAITSVGSYEQHAEDFQRITSSLAPLTNRSWLAVRPSRLLLHRVAAPTTLRALLPASLPQGVTEEMLVLMNHLNSATQVLEPGRVVKIVAGN